VRQLTRDKLASVFKTPEVIRAFEAMVQDVGITLPDAVQAATDAATAAAIDSAAALVAANAAEALVGDLDVRVTVLEAAPPGSGHVIEDEGVPLTQRATINFAGAGVTVTDTGTKTLVTIAGGGGSGGGNSYFPSGW
jgi:hypothetical protein